MKLSKMKHNKQKFTKPVEQDSYDINDIDSYADPAMKFTQREKQNDDQLDNDHPHMRPMKRLSKDDILQRDLVE